MRKRVTTALALLCGVVCACSVYAYTQEVQARAAAQRDEALARFGGDQIEVCIASRNIAPGESIDASNTITKLWLVDLLPENPVTDASSIAGMQASSLIVAGEVLCEARFQPVEDAINVPAGLQAVGVELGTAQAVGGTLSAGTIVDVYAAGSSGTSLVAAGVLVASVAEAQSGRQAITLALPPENVEEVIAATQSTTLYLSLPSTQKGDE